MHLIGIAEKNNLTTVTAPNIQVDLWFSKKNNKLKYYSIRVEHQRIWNVAFINQYGAVDFIANEKNVLSFSQDVDKNIYGIFFQTKQPFENELLRNYVLKIESDKVYLIAIDSQLDIPLLYNKKGGNKLCESIAIFGQA